MILSILITLLSLLALFYLVVARLVTQRLAYHDPGPDAFCHQAEPMGLWLQHSLNHHQTKSSFGYDIAYTTLLNSEADGRWVVLCHGQGGNRFCFEGELAVYLKAGYNVCSLDHRCHGASGKRYLTYGVEESRDLERVIECLDQQYDIEKLVVHGMSFGGAVASIWASRTGHPALQQLVLDSPLVDLKSTLSDLLPSLVKMPDLGLSKLASLICKLRFGFRFEEIVCDSKWAKIKVPVLLLHGDQDNYVPHRYSLNRAQRHTHISLVTIEGAGHSDAFSTQPELYQRELEAVL